MKAFLLRAGLLPLLVALAALLALAPKEIAAQQPTPTQLVTIPVSGMT